MTSLIHVRKVSTADYQTEITADRIFPGQYRPISEWQLIGGLGVSGDGVDQDDYVTSGGAAEFQAPANIRADQIFIGGVRYHISNSRVIPRIERFPVRNGRRAQSHLIKNFLVNAAWRALGDFVRRAIIARRNARNVQRKRPRSKSAVTGSPSGGSTGMLAVSAEKASAGNSNVSVAPIRTQGPYSPQLYFGRP